MPERVCLWMQSVACYFIFQSALLHFLPEGSYKKYIQFYMGLLFIWVLIVTGGKLLGAEETMFEMPDMELQEETESQKEWEQKAYDAENRYWQEREEEVDKHERISGQIKKRISGGCSVSWNFVSDTCNSGEKRDDK